MTEIISSDAESQTPSQEGFPISEKIEQTPNGHIVILMDERTNHPVEKIHLDNNGETTQYEKFSYYPNGVIKEERSQELRKVRNADRLVETVSEYDDEGKRKKAQRITYSIESYANPRGDHLYNHLYNRIEELYPDNQELKSTSFLRTEEKRTPRLPHYELSRNESRIFEEAWRQSGDEIEGWYDQETGLHMIRTKKNEDGTFTTRVFDEGKEIRNETRDKNGKRIKLQGEGVSGELEDVRAEPEPEPEPSSSLNTKTSISPSPHGVDNFARKDEAKIDKNSMGETNTGEPKDVTSFEDDEEPEETPESTRRTNLVRRIGRAATVIRDAFSTYDVEYIPRQKGERRERIKAYLGEGMRRGVSASVERIARIENHKLKLILGGTAIASLVYITGGDSFGVSDAANTGIVDGTMEQIAESNQDAADALKEKVAELKPKPETASHLSTEAITVDPGEGISDIAKDMHVDWNDPDVQNAMQSGEAQDIFKDAGIDTYKMENGDIGLANTGELDAEHVEQLQEVIDAQTEDTTQTTEGGETASQADETGGPQSQADIEAHQRDIAAAEDHGFSAEQLQDGVKIEVKGGDSVTKIAEDHNFNAEQTKQLTQFIEKNHTEGIDFYRFTDPATGNEEIRLFEGRTINLTADQLQKLVRM